MFRLFQVGALVVMAGLGLIDVAEGGLTGDIGGDGGDVLGFVRFLLAIATAAVWLPARGRQSRRLPRAALVLAGVSLFVTLTVLTASPRSYSSPWGLAESFGLLGVTYVLARYAAPVPGMFAIAATGLAVATLPMRGGAEAEYLVAGMFQALCAGGAAAAGMYLRLSQNTRERALLAVRAEQRAEFARDLHDFIAHHVTGIVVQAQGARFIAEQDPQRVITALEQIERAGAETMTSMRRMVGVLRDPTAPPDAPLTPLAGVADLKELLDNFAESGPPEARLYTDGDLGDLPVEVSTSAYRVVMEALTNVRRHAVTARVVDVWVRRTPDWLLVRVANDGAPARPPGPRERNSGYGLVGLEERVRAVGGRLTAGPGVADAGWVVDAALPLNQEVAS
jgi:signal transduction histidine kinase